MKCKTMKLLLGAAACTMLFSMTALAEEKVMPDGGMFDAAYYAQSNPDVVAVFGTDENALYEHYKLCGQAEGRQPYEIKTSAGGNAVSEGFTTFKVEKGFANSDEYGKYGKVIGLNIGKDLEKVKLDKVISYDYVGNGVPQHVDQEYASLSQPGESRMEKVMNYVIGGGGSKISHIRTGNADYTFYIYKDGIKYREDLHFRTDDIYLEIDTITYGAVGPATAEETALVENRLKQNHELTVKNGGAGNWQERGFASLEQYEDWYVNTWVRGF